MVFPKKGFPFISGVTEQLSDRARTARSAETRAPPAFFRLFMRGKNAEPLPDFGGPSSAWHGHADPNLTYAVELVKDMGLTKEGNKAPTRLARAQMGGPLPVGGKKKNRRRGRLAR